MLSFIREALVKSGVYKYWVIRNEVVEHLRNLKRIQDVIAANVFDQNEEASAVQQDVDGLLDPRTKCVFKLADTNYAKQTTEDLLWEERVGSEDDTGAEDTTSAHAWLTLTARKDAEGVEQNETGNGDAPTSDWRKQTSLLHKHCKSLEKNSALLTCLGMLIEDVENIVDSDQRFLSVSDSRHLATFTTSTRTDGATQTVSSLLTKAAGQVSTLQTEMRKLLVDHVQDETTSEQKSRFSLNLERYHAASNSNKVDEDESACKTKSKFFVEEPCARCGIRMPLCGMEFSLVLPKKSSTTASPTHLSCCSSCAYTLRIKEKVCPKRAILHGNGYDPGAEQGKTKKCSRSAKAHLYCPHQLRCLKCDYSAFEACDKCRIIRGDAHDLRELLYRLKIFSRAREDGAGGGCTTMALEESLTSYTTATPRPRTTSCSCSSTGSSTKIKNTPPSKMLASPIMSRDTVASTPDGLHSSPYAVEEDEALYTYKELSTIAGTTLEEDRDVEPRSTTQDLDGISTGSWSEPGPVASGPICTTRTLPYHDMEAHSFSCSSPIISCHLFFDFDLTLCSTKGGANPLSGNHALDPELVDLIVDFLERNIDGDSAAGGARPSPTTASTRRPLVSSVTILTKNPHREEIATFIAQTNPALRHVRVVTVPGKMSKKKWIVDEILERGTEVCVFIDDDIHEHAAFEEKEGRSGFEEKEEGGEAKDNEVDKKIYRMLLARDN
ncbi:unnamed protein product [Amoebophrya sp. A25]|nr:unnamed protein product [Amoebophrya sp. A25]|eukprot:GSA25T00024874001.1